MKPNTIEIEAKGVCPDCGRTKLKDTFTLAEAEDYALWQADDSRCTKCEAVTETTVVIAWRGEDD